MFNTTGRSIIKGAKQCRQKKPSRLNPTQLNNLNLSHMVGRYTDCTIEDEIMKKASIDGTSICVFQAVSDNKNPQKRQNLAYINDVIQQFEQNNPSKKTTLLIPLMQSRLWKGHCVLVEVTIAEGKKEITIHDSQSWWRNLFYPNCLKDLKKQGFQVEYKSYGKQKDNYSCVYFVYNYIKKILETSSEGLKSIFVSLNDKPVQDDPIGKLIKDNFQKKYTDVRDIQSGENIPWEKDSKASYQAYLGISASKQSQVKPTFFQRNDSLKILSLSESQNNTSGFFQSPPLFATEVKEKVAQKMAP